MQLIMLVLFSTIEAHSFDSPSCSGSLLVFDVKKILVLHQVSILKF